MSLSKHTPTPWEYVHESSDYGTGDPTITFGFIQQCEDQEFIIASLIVDVPDGRANGEFIVRAVNSHDALVAALKEITEHYCALVNSGDAGSWDPEGDDEVKHARSALALVEQFQSD